MLEGMPSLLLQATEVEGPEPGKTREVLKTAKSLLLHAGKVLEVQGCAAVVSAAMISASRELEADNAAHVVVSVDVVPVDAVVVVNSGKTSNGELPSRLDCQSRCPPFEREMVAPCNAPSQQPLARTLTFHGAWLGGYSNCMGTFLTSVW